MNQPQNSQVARIPARKAPPEGGRGDSRGRGIVPGLFSSGRLLSPTGGGTIRQFLLGVWKRGRGLWGAPDAMAQGCWIFSMCGAYGHPNDVGVRPTEGKIGDGALTTPRQKTHHSGGDAMTGPGGTWGP